MREDFCAFILTHGRPHSQHTYRTLRTHGYTGPIFIVIDDEDETAEEYKRIFGDEVLVFSKDEVALYTDQYDNAPDRRGVLWARNACWKLAKENGYRYFIELDDDYTYWGYRRAGLNHQNAMTTEIESRSWKIGSMDLVFNAMVNFVETTSAKTIALGQGGDIPSVKEFKWFKRKAMNSYVCDIEKPFLFRGKFNDDVNTYVSLGRMGQLFCSYMGAYLTPVQSQSQSGGMTELYANAGTYVKSFYAVMAAPSCVTIVKMGIHYKRLHHRINWNKAVPLIIPQEFKKNGTLIGKRSA